MTRFLITFADGQTYTALAADHEAAQEIAIESFENAGVVHDAIVSIRRVGGAA